MNGLVLNGEDVGVSEIFEPRNLSLLQYFVSSIGCMNELPFSYDIVLWVVRGHQSCNTS